MAKRTVAKRTVLTKAAKEIKASKGAAKAVKRAARAAVLSKRAAAARAKAAAYYGAQAPKLYTAAEVGALLRQLSCQCCRKCAVHMNVEAATAEMTGGKKKQK